MLSCNTQYAEFIRVEKILIGKSINTLKTSSFFCKLQLCSSCSANFVNFSVKRAYALVVKIDALSIYGIESTAEEDTENA